MALLLFSIGVPMISGGDELGRTQGGNNGYCQDNEISWSKWDLDADEEKFLAFVQKLVAIRKDQLAIRRKEFFKGQVDEDGIAMNDVEWYGRHGGLMTEEGWTNPESKCVGMLLEGKAIVEPDVVHGSEVHAKSLLLIANASHVVVPFKLPEYDYLKNWLVIVDTANPERAVEQWQGGDVPARSVMLLERR